MAHVEHKTTTENKSSIDVLIEKGTKAFEEFLKLDQKQIDEIIKYMALAGLNHQLDLAKLAVEETTRGIVEDKVTKNIFATEYIYHSIKHQKTVGIIENSELNDYMVLAEPMGIVAGITPVTNPTSTTMFKAIIAVKSRNPIVFAFHPSAQRCSSEAARIVRDAAIKAGAPVNCIQWVEAPSIQATQDLMNHPGIALVLATGGSSMVKAAYSTGKPALGVGPGNVPCFIEKSANVPQAVNDLILSKSFDNGMICASEQAAIIDKTLYDKVVSLMKAQGCYFANREEIEKVSKYLIRPDGGVNPDAVGRYPHVIAQAAGFQIPKETKILCCEIENAGPEYPLSREKLSPVLAIIKAKDSDDGIRLAVEMLKLRGMGHTAVIHSYCDDIIKKFSSAVQVGRIVVNCPSSQGAIGDIYNSLMPSLTLGCGSYGSNSTTSNVSSANLINIKRVAKRKTNMQWFKIPDKIYFEPNSICYLEKMPDVHRAFIVTDKMMVKLGYVDRVLKELEKRELKVAIKIFDDVEPDPSLRTILAGKDVMDDFKPDTIIAVGGGSPIDAAKIMWLYHENPNADFESMAQKFLDIRKRAYKFPKLGLQCKFVAIPTTSGTGSEVTPFAVVKDERNNIKYPLADYELTPDVAILDPNFVMSMPKKSTAFTGMDALSHAIESYVSILASDFTDGLSAKAVDLIFKHLPISYKEGTAHSREKMHNASCIAGMSFSNAFLGVNHSLAHKIGAEFEVPHGLANAMIMPHVIMYNGNENPSKFTPFPKYNHYVAPQKYCELSKLLGLKFNSTHEGVSALAKAVHHLGRELELPMSLKEFGVDEQVFLSRIEYLADNAFNDQCTTANPRLPLIKELAELLKGIYYGFNG